MVIVSAHTQVSCTHVSTAHASLQARLRARLQGFPVQIVFRSDFVVGLGHVPVIQVTVPGLEQFHSVRLWPLYRNEGRPFERRALGCPWFILREGFLHWERKWRWCEGQTQTDDRMPFTPGLLPRTGLSLQPLHVSHSKVNPCSIQNLASKVFS